MNEQDSSLLIDTTDRLFTEHCPPELLTQTEGGAFPEALWAQLSAVGLLSLLLPEDRGGIEGGPAVLAGILRVAGRFGAPGPLAETILARWALDEAGRDIPEAALLLAFDGWRAAGGKLKGRVRAARPSDEVVILAEAPGGAPFLAQLPLSRFETAETRILAGERLYDVAIGAEIAAAAGQEVSRGLNLRVRSLLSLARAALSVGAMERVMALSVAYAGDRVQFGRPIGKFQAVQQQLARLAGAVAASSAITDAAARALEVEDESLLVDVARVRLSDAIDVATYVAHQVHGAIGITHEYQLQYFTRRLWAWRDEGCSMPHARSRIAAAFAACDAEALWPELVAATGASTAPSP